MRAFLSIAVVLVFIPFVYLELDMQNKIMENVNEIKYNTMERLIFDEFRYNAEDAFLLLISEDFNNNEFEEFTCSKLTDWAGSQNYNVEINYFYEDSKLPHMGNLIILHQCMLFLGYEKEIGRARLSPKIGSEYTQPHLNAFLAAGGKILEGAGVYLGFIAEKEIQGTKVRAIIKGSELVESTSVS